MSWLNRLLIRSSANRTDVVFPVDVDLGSGLCVHLYCHEIDTQAGKVTCWSYVTDGLTSKGQKELVFTLRGGPGEPADAFPRDPLDVFRSISELAEQSRPVDVGGVTQFAGRKLFSRHLAYIDSETFPGVPVPRFGLAAILVTDDEVRAGAGIRDLARNVSTGFRQPLLPVPTMV